MEAANWYNGIRAWLGGDADARTLGVTLVTEAGDPISSAAPATPAAGAASEVTTGGTAVVALSGPIGGGFVTNPPNAASQGIGAAENLYLDMVGTPGSTDADGNGTTVTLVPGQTFVLPSLATGVSVRVNAATSGHKFSVTKW